MNKRVISRNKLEKVIDIQYPYIESKTVQNYVLYYDPLSVYYGAK